MLRKKKYCSGDRGVCIKRERGGRERERERDKHRAGVLDWLFVTVEVKK